MLVHSVNVITLLAFVLQAHAMEHGANRGDMEELAANHTSDMQDFMHKLVDKLSDKLVDKLFDRPLKASLHHASLDNVTLGKPGHFAMPRQAASFPASFRPPCHLHLTPS